MFRFQYLVKYMLQFKYIIFLFQCTHQHIIMQSYFPVFVGYIERSWTYFIIYPRVLKFCMKPPT